MNRDILTVTQLNFYVKSLLDSDTNLNNLYINGEISNFKIHFASGCAYFSIKDEKSSIRCMMFKNSVQNLKFKPKDGIFVLIQGNVTLYSASGQYQIIVKSITPISQGNIDLSFQITKEKLLKEGLFDKKYKKKLPEFPNKVGIITSANAAVLQDIRNVLDRRYPIATLILGKTKVQGQEAVPDIIKNLEIFNKHSAADVIIIARGGGSAEELSVFNEEDLARAVFASKIPVISAIGHETDFTICDFVADLRAPTPSAAAELASPDLSNLREKITNISKCLDKIIYEKISDLKLQLSMIESSITKNVKMKLRDYKNKLEFFDSKLKILNPKDILKRGYSIVRNENDQIVSKLKEVKINSNILVALSDGVIKAKVCHVKEY